MIQRNIEVVVNPSGELKIDAIGFSGADCEKATAFLEQALGKISEKRRKPDYYRQAFTKREQRIGR